VTVFVEKVCLTTDSMESALRFHMILRPQHNFTADNKIRVGALCADPCHPWFNPYLFLSVTSVDHLTDLMSWGVGVVTPQP
jgi:hypothetical protein